MSARPIIAADALSPCPGCGALFAPYDGPTHRYVGASPACWALFTRSIALQDPDATILAESRIPDTPVEVPRATSPVPLDQLVGDAYGVQHHGDDSPPAVRSVASHLLDLHGIISGRTTSPRWPLSRAVRNKGAFHKLEPPPRGLALTIRHLFPGGGVTVPVTPSEYVLSVYEAWMARHRATVERWYARYVEQE